MNYNIQSCLFLLVLSVSTCVGSSGEYCYISGNTKYCQYGCCDDGCCGISTVAIVGMVIGGIMALVALISCIVCVACLCKSHNRRSNVQPVHNSNSVYVNSSYPNYPPQGQPPSYNNYGQYPPSSSYNRYEQDSVYPPGFVHPPPYSAQKS